MHHNIEDYKYLFKKNRYIKYIHQDKIIECLKESNLIITDFSSVIFDAIFRYIPYIIYIPDSEDHELKNMYNSNYYDIINGLKNRTIYFENTFFNLNKTINKILYYIKNNFKMEKNMEIFYKSFNLEGGKNMMNIINYLNLL